MRVLHLRASNFYGGPERQLHFHARLAAQKGVDLTVASFTESGKTPEFVETIRSDNLPTHVFIVKSAYDFTAIRNLRDYLKLHQIDILCTHDYRTHLIGLLARRGTSTKWLAFSRGWTSENLKIKLFHTLDKFFVRFADHIVAVSHSQKEKLIHLAVSEEKITVVHNAIDIASFCAIEAENLRSRFHFPDESIIIASGGRFSAEKGQKYLVESALIALQANPNLRFLLFGDGPDLENIRMIISQAGREKEILCPGYEKKLPSFLKGADILVNPSLSEGLPNIVLEGLALRVPVIATAVGGVPEIITEGHNGYLVPSKDSHALAEKLLMAASGKDNSAAIIENGVKTIEAKFSFEAQNANLVEIYQKMTCS